MGQPSRGRLAKHLLRNGLRPGHPRQGLGRISEVHDIPNDNIISERHRHDSAGGVCLSLDFAASWKPQARGLPLKAVTSVVLDPKSPRNSRTLYAGVFSEGVFKTTDDGRTWTLKKEGLGHPDNMRVSRVFLHPDGTLYAMICARRPAPRQPLAPEGVGLYRSRNGGEAWQCLNPPQPWLYPKDFSVHPRDSEPILVGACDSKWEDNSGGLSSARTAAKPGGASPGRARRPWRLLSSRTQRLALYDSHRRRPRGRSMAQPRQRPDIATRSTSCLLQTSSASNSIPPAVPPCASPPSAAASARTGRP